MLDSETLKKRLRYQGQQYANGQMARGGVREPHMLEQAADRIEELERCLLNVRDGLKDAPNPNVASYIEAVLDGGYTPDNAFPDGMTAKDDKRFNRAWDVGAEGMPK